MKRHNVFTCCTLILAAAMSMTLASCNTHEAELEAAQRANDSLQQILNDRNNDVQSLMDVIEEIENNMTAITSNYTNIRNLKIEGPESPDNNRATITEEMNQIEQLLKTNRDKIAGLNKKISTMGAEGDKLRSMVASLEERMTAQEEQITQLEEELKAKNIEIATLKEDKTNLESSVSSLSAANEEQSRTIARQTAEANRAYYVVGSYDELKNWGIVEKKGGFIGIGRKQMIVANMPTDRFETIDRTQVTTIPVERRGAVVISTHPTNSYELVYNQEDQKKVDYLRILDPHLFWQNTPYLIISSN